MNPRPDRLMVRLQPSTNQYSDEKIVDAWTKNALPWAAAVRDGQIESRILATNQAIVDAVLSRSPASVLDIGCGEGWLVRELAGRVARTLGVDVVPDLIERARAGGRGDFLVASYEAIADGVIEESFDVVVCNFSLLGRESVNTLFRTLPPLLNPGGALIVQTLHPIVACGDSPYVDGWRDGSWAGFGPGFTDPAPWYFRTLENWTNLFTDHGLQLLETRESIDPRTQQPASIILIGSCR